jgi:hypothetical protein
MGYPTGEVHSKVELSERGSVSNLNGHEGIMVEVVHTIIARASVS